MNNNTMNQMNKEQIIDEVYEKYYTTLIDSITFSERGKYFKSNGLEFNSGYPNYVHYSKEEFIDKCKTDPEFSETWGLKIEERELSWDERADLSREKRRTYANWPYWSLEEMEYHLTDVWNIPTRLITLTYNNETTESYE